MTVEIDREYPLQEGRTARYYKVGDWGFDYITNADGSVDPESDANIEYAERAIAAWTEWRDWLEENLPKPPVTQPGEVWLLSQPGRRYQNVPAVVNAGGRFAFNSEYDQGFDYIGVEDAVRGGWTMKRIWPEEEK
jgi:hypothetical protein